MLLTPAPIYIELLQFDDDDGRDRLNSDCDILISLTFPLSLVPPQRNG